MSLPFHVLGHLSLMLLMIGLIITGIAKAHRKGDQWFKMHRGFAVSGVISGLIGFCIDLIDYPCASVIIRGDLFNH